MGWMQNWIMRLFKITPAIDKQIVIKEPLSHGGNVLKNRLWYRGDPSELDQYYKAIAIDDVSKSRFWAASPSPGLNIRKIHSGIPALIADKLADIVVADLDAVDIGNKPKEGEKESEEQKRWDEIAQDNEFDILLGQTVSETLTTGDGAFKISIDSGVTDYPIIEFFSGERVKYIRRRGRLHEVIFNTIFTKDQKDYRLDEIYGKGYVSYKLFDGEDSEVPLPTLEETKDLVDITFSDKFIMAVPIMFFKSPKFNGRGKSIYDTKTDSFDALDEVISQWIDAIRDTRVNKYIPEDLIPRDPKTGVLMPANPFDNRFIKIAGELSENGNKIDVTQVVINYEAYVTSYSSALDMCLQGIVSPGTLGIDLKKLDNAEAQREKEKATLYTRGKIVDALTNIIPAVVEVALKAQDVKNNKPAGEYDVTVKFGEYASPSFDSVVETVGKAKTLGIMSTERAIEELYGDSWTEKEKADEILKIKSENGINVIDEPEARDGIGDS
jgi:hypothetical protein